MYKQIVDSTDWFYVSKQDHGLIIYHVAAWALTEEGIVTGLVSDPAAWRMEKKNLVAARLIGVPPIDGYYKHKSELNVEELAQIKKELAKENEPCEA